MWVYFVILYAYIFILIVIIDRYNIRSHLPTPDVIKYLNSLCRAKPLPKIESQQFKLRTFRIELRQQIWKLYLLNHGSLNLFNETSLCSFCGNSCESFSASFTRGFNANSQKHLCKKCLSQTLPSLFSMKDHIDLIFQTRNLRHMHPVDIQVLFEYGIFENQTAESNVDAYLCLCRETFRCLNKKIPLSQILIEDWIIANRYLLTYDSRYLALDNEYTSFGLNKCLCSRPIDRLVNDQYCSQCSNYLDIRKPYHLPQQIYSVNPRRREFIDGSQASTYLNALITNMSSCVDLQLDWECGVCRENALRRFRFGCGHFICEHCALKIACIGNHIFFGGLLLKCPYCRDPCLFFPEGDLKLGAELITDFSRTMFRYVSIPLDRRHHYQSQTILREMMKYHNRPAWEYLIQLEANNLLGWCPSYPTGLLRYRAPDLQRYQYEVKTCRTCSKLFSTSASFNLQCRDCWKQLKQAVILDQAKSLDEQKFDPIAKD